MKLKILHILDSLRTGGLENGVVNLVNRLDPERFEHAICCIDASGPMAERITRPVEIVALNKGPRKDYLLSFKLACVIRDIGPDIVHTRNWGSIDGIVGARLAGVRRVVHGEHGREATDPTGANCRRNWARRLLNPFVSRFVTVSNDLQTWLIDEVKIPGKKVRRIINGVNTGRFRPATDQRVVRESLGLCPDSFIVGTVGRLDPVKDQATLLRAFAAISRHGCGELLIVGSGPEEEGLHHLARELGISDRARFLGERTDIPELMQAMDIFVLPSIAEGISNTILEAMACGLPVVATQVGGNGELVADGKSGTLFPSGDCQKLAAILADYMGGRGLIIAHGIEGRKRAEQDFSLTRMVSEYESLYLSITKT